MNLTPFADLARVLAAFLLLYGIVPLAVWRFVPGAPDRLALSFLESVFVMQVATLILGDWRLATPTTLGMVYAVWLVARSLSRPALQSLASGDAWQHRLVAVWQAIDRRCLPRIMRFWWIGPYCRASEFLAGAMVVLAVHSQSSFFRLRFLTEQSYERALSLEKLLHNSGWNRDGSVAFLAPVSWLSGVGGAAVIHWAGPLAAMLISLAAAYCGWAYSGQRSAALGALALASAVTWWWTAPLVAEPGRDEIAVIFWLLAVGLARRHLVMALVSIMVALTVSMNVPALLWLLLLAAGAGLAACRITARVPAIAVLLPLVLAVQLSPTAVSADGPWQYEAAARVVDRIARTIPRNQWLVISPSHEVPLLYGLGWHVELADFVATIPLEAAGRPAFRLPYDSPHIFLFVEKRPLGQASAGVPAGFEYATRAGRESLEFQAGRLAAVYRAAHPGTAVYYEDEDLVVYQVEQ